MKKTLFALPLLLLVMLAAACSHGDSGRSTDGESAVPQQSEQDSEGVTPEMPAKTAKPAQKPRVMEFSATWCGPCQKMKPIYEAAMQKYGDKIDMESIDVDENPALAERYHINSIPTFVCIDSQGNVSTLSGFMDEGELDSMLQKLLK